MDTEWQIIKQEIHILELQYKPTNHLLLLVFTQELLRTLGDHTNQDEIKNIPVCSLPYGWLFSRVLIFTVWETKMISWI